MTKEEKPFKWVGTRPVRPDGVEKVTGQAAYGADFVLPRMVVGRVLRSPHAHARIKAIHTARAAALPGVLAIVTAADFPELPSEFVPSGEALVNFRFVSMNAMARDKALYEGHAVAAVAAINAEVAAQALDLIKVDYQVLPHVIDVRAAMSATAPVLYADMLTSGVEPPAVQASNISSRTEFSVGDIVTGFAAADVIIEREYTTEAVHQGYIEPHACVVSTASDGAITIWSSSQGHFMVREFCAKLLKIDLSKIRVIPAEIGGGFGGKTTVYLEPLAIVLSRKAGRPVKMVMTRTEVFRASGPTSGSHLRVKLGATRDGKLTAAELTLAYQAGAFPGASVKSGCMVGFAPYEIAHARAVGYDVVSNRPKATAYRAPGAPMAGFAIESAIDELALALAMDPLDLRLKNAVRAGSQQVFGPKFPVIGYVETLQAALAHPHYHAPLLANQGRGVASGFWFNIGGQSSATVNLNDDGTVEVINGNPDIGGSRASMQMMAAEVLGIELSKIKSVIADTSAIGYSFLTGGSRVTFATGKAVIDACNDVIAQLCVRAAKIWACAPAEVSWRDGSAHRNAGSAATPEQCMSLSELAAMASKTGGSITGKASPNVGGAGAGFGTHICDVEVDPETGHTSVIRYTAIQDVGRAIHPGYVEGQMQGGAVQGIGWALNEEYVYDEAGCLQNAGFLDYRMPVASDLPMIDTVLVEVPNPNHPYGVRGVGEVPIIAPLAAVANAIARASGVRILDLPISPPRLLAALAAART